MFNIKTYIKEFCVLDGILCPLPTAIIPINVKPKKQITLIESKIFNKSFKINPFFKN